MTHERLAAYNRLAVLDHLIGWHLLDSAVDVESLYAESLELEKVLGWEEDYRSWGQHVPVDHYVRDVPPSYPRLPSGEIDFEATPVLDMTEFEASLEEV